MSAEQPHRGALACLPCPRGASMRRHNRAVQLLASAVQHQLQPPSLRVQLQEEEARDWEEIRRSALYDDSGWEKLGLFEKTLALTFRVLGSQNSPIGQLMGPLSILLDIAGKFIPETNDDSSRNRRRHGGSRKRSRPDTEDRPEPKLNIRQRRHVSLSPTNIYEQEARTLGDERHPDTASTNSRSGAHLDGNNVCDTHSILSRTINKRRLKSSSPTNVCKGEACTVCNERDLNMPIENSCCGAHLEKNNVFDADRVHSRTVNKTKSVSSSPSNICEREARTLHDERFPAEDPIENSCRLPEVPIGNSCRSAHLDGNHVCETHRFLSTTVNEQRPKHFYVDSGAAFHSTYDQSILKSYPPHLKIEPPIKFVNGFTGPGISVQGCGYIDDDGGTLDFVLHIPESTANLVSVGQLTLDYPAKVVFYKDKVWIEELESGERIGQGHRHGNSNHYVLNSFNPKHAPVDRPK